MRRSRMSKLAHFYSLYDNGRVLDVGVSNNEHNPSVNLFLNNFRLPVSYYTGLGIQPLDEIAARHPGKTFVRYDGGAFPFSSKEFGWVFSNAVIEHVGDHAEQVLFLNEMLRVGRKVFFTTPNKYFPVEMHTNTLFRHWAAGNSFYEWCALHKPYWTKANLNLLAYKKLKSLLVESMATEYQIHRNRFFGWTMTFTVVCHA